MGFGNGFLKCGLVPINLKGESSASIHQILLWDQLTWLEASEASIHTSLVGYNAMSVLATSHTVCNPCRL